MFAMLTRDALLRHIRKQIYRRGDRQLRTFIYYVLLIIHIWYIFAGYCVVCQEEKTPLHHAAEDGLVDAVRLFLRDYHANITVTSTVSEILAECMCFRG